MTEFEQEVAAALAPIIATEGLGLPPWMARPTADALAPRVAAALQDALAWNSLLPVSRAVDEMSGAERIALMQQQGRDAFVRALRGSGETPQP